MAEVQNFDFDLKSEQFFLFVTIDDNGNDLSVIWSDNWIDKNYCHYKTMDNSLRVAFSFVVKRLNLGK